MFSLNIIQGRKNSVAMVGTRTHAAVIKIIKRRSIIILRLIETGRQQVIRQDRRR
jgi:hypothetical protein